VADPANTSGLFDEVCPAGCLVVLFTHAGGGDADQKQSLAYSPDAGETWNLHPENPVLPNPGIEHFRDPKVFRHEPTARWIMALAAGDRVKLYGSANLTAWSHLSDFGPGQGDAGGPWECPDLFPLPVADRPGQTRWVLKVDVSEGFKHGGSGGQYFVGDFDGERFHNANPPEQVLWVDHGMDFYAAQSWSGIPASDGRRIIIAWMNNWQYALKVPTKSWRGVMCLPRELDLVHVPGEGVRLRQRPVAEWRSLRSRLLYEAEELSLEEGSSLLPQSTAGDALEIVARFRADTAVRFGLFVHADAKQRTVVGYDVEARELYLDRSRSGDVSCHPRFPGRHGGPASLADGSLEVRVFVDRCTVEVFGLSGLVTISDQVFPLSPRSRVGLFAEGGRVRVESLALYALSPAGGARTEDRK